MSNVFLELESRRWAAEQDRANRSRSGRFTVSFKTQGGGMVAGQEVMFPTPFMERPTVSTGLVLTAGPVNPAKLPLVTVIVTDFYTDSRGFYTGAKLAVRVDTLVAYRLTHDVTFEGRAIKVSAGSFT